MNIVRHPPREAMLAFLAIGIAAAFSVTTPGFMDPLNLADRSRHWVEVGLIAVPMTFIIASGGIDLSVGAMLAFAGVVGGRCHLAGCPLAVVILASIATGLIAGLFNASAILGLRLPPLIVTLATLALFRGLAYGITNAQPISGWPAEFTDWGSSAGLMLAENWQVPWSFFILLLVVAAGTVGFHRHAFGRRVCQLGENPIAARFAGVDAARITWLVYGLSGLVCGIAAVTWTARFATAHPSAGLGLELEVIAVVVVGGTRITGGAGSVPGTLLGLLVLGLLRYGLDLRSVTQQHQTILIGVLVVVVAILNESWARRLAR